MRIRGVTMWAAEDAFDELRRFYAEVLGLAVDAEEHRFHVTAGPSVLTFLAASAARPCHHFALLVPGDRFAEARRWAGDRVGFLRSERSGEVAFEFEAWDASALYFEDPVGNVVELIAHRDIGLGGPEGFSPRSLLGISEMGLACPDLQRAAAELGGAGIEVWSGDPSDPDGLVFAGERAHTIILAPVGRHWMPTDRSAEVNPVSILVEGTVAAEVTLSGLPYRIESRLGAGA